MNKTYKVTLTFQFPAWDEKNGIDYSIQATSKSEAIKSARWQATRDGHAGQGVCKGRQSFRAVEEI